jgi:carbohydrate esterase-like sialic acid-specific acetylesterase
LRAFVWWQGENDASQPAIYANDLATFIDRVRAENGNPSLLVIICGVNSDPGFDGIRNVQQAYVASHPNAKYVPSDDLTPDGPHLTADGYATMAKRIIAAIP